MAEFFRINSKKIKAPTDITISYEVLDKSERTMDGTMVVDIIGTKRKVDVSWDYMSKEDMALLNRETTQSPFVSISYTDPETGELTSITARVQDPTHQPYYDWAKGVVMWRSVGVSFVER